jgi:hypothetical protein
VAWVARKSTDDRNGGCQKRMTPSSFVVVCLHLTGKQAAVSMPNFSMVSPLETFQG